ncbi:hypothetical protein QAD02_020164 [Eretmocerus hayati]|uniref:Uncharacterized protein n=1 Tax=Eretmocerus hayati TaxID=131215 RepID=A0ACC2PPU7_9HYME|nr:hypothetical protein QAD02_020164 [Eretmocerus hayati]
MDDAATGSVGAASDFASDNMNTWDVARDIVNGPSTSRSLLTNYAVSPSSLAILDRNYRGRAGALDASDSWPVNCDGPCSAEIVEIQVERKELGDNNGEMSELEDILPRDSYDMSNIEAEQLLFSYGAMSSFDMLFNGTFNDSQAWNGSYDNETYIVHGLYPSGYKLPHIIIAAIFVTILMIVIVVGNMLVIIAIATEKALKNIQNWFIASLAVADFFLGLVIMPFSLANEIMGYWIFGYWWCDVHSAMDVLLCTASIMNLCLISLDRFWSITRAVEYLRERTPARAALMIAMVWVLSAVICIPPLLGWKRDAPEEEYPKCKVSL